MSPIYEFQCKECDLLVSEIFNIKYCPEALLCPHCNKDMPKVISVGQFKVNGANANNRYSGPSNSVLKNRKT